MKQLLKKKDVAKLCQLSERQVGRLVRSGQLRPIRIGRLIRFDEQEVTTFLARLKDSRAHDRQRAAQAQIES